MATAAEKIYREIPIGESRKFGPVPAWLKSRTVEIVRLSDTRARITTINHNLDGFRISENYSSDVAHRLIEEALGL